MRIITAAFAAICITLLAACGGGPPKATVDTCTTELVAHPHESKWGQGCKGLSKTQQWDATIAAYAQGARG